MWASREFLLDTCCASMHDAVVEFLNEDPRRAGKWLGNTGLNEMVRGLTGFDTRLRRVLPSDGQLLLDWNLALTPVSWRTAKAFVKAHHRHCPPPAGWRFGAGVMNGADLVGVVMVGRPVARMLDQVRIVEVNRLCVREDLAQGLAWNACSLLYGWAAREAKKRGFERIITYTLARESGTTLAAAGWTAESRTRGRSWSAPSRPRADKRAREDKVRWCRTLVRHPTSLLRTNSFRKHCLSKTP